MADQLFCESCNIQIAEARCRECNMLFCQNCKEGHLRLPMCRNHQFDPVLPLTGQNYSLQIKDLQDRMRASELTCSDLMGQWGQYAIRLRSEKEATLRMIDQSEASYQKAVKQVHERLRQHVNAYISAENAHCQVNTQSLRTKQSALQSTLQNMVKQVKLDPNTQSHLISTDSEIACCRVVPTNALKTRLATDLNVMETSLSSLKVEHCGVGTVNMNSVETAMANASLFSPPIQTETGLSQIKNVDPVPVPLPVSSSHDVNTHFTGAQTQISRTGAQAQTPQSGSHLPHFHATGAQSSPNNKTGFQMPQLWEPAGASAFPMEPTAPPDLPTYEQATALPLPQSQLPQTGSHLSNSAPTGSQPQLPAAGSPSRHYTTTGAQASTHAQNQLDYATLEPTTDYTSLLDLIPLHMKNTCSQLSPTAVSGDQVEKIHKLAEVNGDIWLLEKNGKIHVANPINLYIERTILVGDTDTMYEDYKPKGIVQMGDGSIIFGGPKGLFEIDQFGAILNCITQDGVRDVTVDSANQNHLYVLLDKSPPACAAFEKQRKQNPRGWNLMKVANVFDTKSLFPKILVCNQYIYVTKKNFWSSNHVFRGYFCLANPVGDIEFRVIEKDTFKSDPRLCFIDQYGYVLIGEWSGGLLQIYSVNSPIKKLQIDKFAASFLHDGIVLKNGHIVLVSDSSEPKLFLYKGKTRV